MPLFFQQQIDDDTRLAVWKIEEDQAFFNVPLQKTIKHPQKRLQHLAGRYLLRHLFPDFPLSLVRIADTRKPYLEDEAFHFSISHCGDFAAAIVSKSRRVGIDIEVPTERVERIKEKFLHEEELQFVTRQMSNVKEPIATTSDTLQTPNFKLETANTKLTLLWSSKEAVFKWWSYGKVDFSEMIRISDLPQNESGMLKAKFIQDRSSYSLLISYKIFKDLCLAWVATE